MKIIKLGKEITITPTIILDNVQCVTVSVENYELIWGGSVVAGWIRLMNRFTFEWNNINWFKITTEQEEELKKESEGSKECSMKDCISENTFGEYDSFNDMYQLKKL